MNPSGLGVERGYCPLSGLGPVQEIEDVQEAVKTGAVGRDQGARLDNFDRPTWGEAPLGASAEEGTQATWCPTLAVAGAGEASS